MLDELRSNEIKANDVEITSPLVSVIISFYKHEAYVAEAVESVRRNGYAPIEIIIVDDGSPVSAASVLGPNDDVLIIRTENGGAAAARNRGFRSSSGEFLLFLDSDDRLIPGAIASHMVTLAGHPEAALSFGAAATIDAGGNRILPPSLCRPRKDYFLKLLEGNPIASPGAAVMRREAFMEAGFFDEQFKNVEDYRLYLKIARRHPFVLINRHVLDRRLHGSNKSGNKERMLAATLLALDRIEAEDEFSKYELKRLARGRRRWTHDYRPENTLAYRIRSLYYRFRAMFSVSPMEWARSFSDDQKG
jgi:glycosyltransferase involved in cell wall biosynthesis